MTKRAWKVVFLLASGGAVLQLGGCAGQIALILAQNLVSGFLSSALASVVSTAAGDTAGTTP